jgi:hypothetical protein
MSIIKKYNDFINESFTEFNLQRMNPDSARASVHVDDPQLSINAFDKHQDAIRAAMSRINDILYNLKGTSAYSALRSKLGLEDQDIQEIKIQRIIKVNNISYDVYLTTKIDGQEYWGKITNVMEIEPKFTSEIFKDFDLLQPKEWVIKIKGLVVKTIKRWLKPEPGIYKLLNNEVICYSVDTGKQLKMEKGIEIELVRAHEDKLIVKSENDYYNLVGDNYIYFNWWFEKVD